jgi:hypothetical protein
MPEIQSFQVHVYPKVCRARFHGSERHSRKHHPLFNSKAQRSGASGRFLADTSLLRSGSSFQAGIGVTAQFNSRGSFPPRRSQSLLQRFRNGSLTLMEARFQTHV